ncbi:hypothetical protein ACEWY4_021179 [Coilia grayii]|uniref:B box-type domain-containing protein n=1 Tax=Coilia grayii TaxID=363190 RepID=A0ABD1JBG6_9TELE
MDEHKGHDNVLAAKERTEQQEAGEHCEQFFTELLQCVEGARAKVRARIRQQQMAAEREAEGTIKELEQEMAELKRRDVVLQRLSQQDDVHFLKEVQQIPASYETKTFNLKTLPLLSSPFELIKKSVSELKDRVKDACLKFEVKVNEKETTIFLEVKDFSHCSGCVRSPSVLLENLPWTFVIQPCTAENTTFLSFYLAASSQVKNNYCMSCISDCWNQEEQKGVGPQTCPQCRETFSPRPVLNKSVVLADLVEKLRTTPPQLNPFQLPYAGPDDVICDVCTERKFKAVKSCLVCVASYCESHIQAHYQSDALKKHTLTEASYALRENICPQHNRLLEVFCRTDGICICVLCAMDEHKGHDNVLAATERAEQQKTFEKAKKLCQELIERRNEELHMLNTVCVKDAAQEAGEHCEQVFTELFQCVEGARAKARARIREQHMAAEREAEGTIKELEQEMAELKRRDVALQRLSQQDDAHFLKEVQQIPTSYESKTFNLPTLPLLTSPFELIKKSVSEFKDRVKDACFRCEVEVSEEGTTIFLEVKDFSHCSGCVRSPSILLENLPWTIFIKPHTDGNERFLSFYLDASSQVENKSCTVEACLKVINQQDVKKSFSRKIIHKFCDEQSDWGFRKFMPWNDLMNPAKGFVKNDKVIFLVTLWAKRDD